MKRLMLLSCSATKREDVALLSAIERYQGPFYQVVKANRPSTVDIWIVSAEFGLISEHEKIPYYDRKLLPARAQELERIVGAALDNLLQQDRYVEVFINLGKLYAQTLCRSILLPRFREAGLVVEAHGAIGLRMRQTTQWLLGVIKTEQKQVARGPLPCASHEDSSSAPEDRWTALSS